ncbi:MAG: 4a-hydroxytetrahydrobiopterin dehydratase [Candidatus Marinimicrobia bacterium]|nr:4a-hydroxytetrahydrobiopterin dehydratase [Candidatus Neomarinimicrobiota bacterium]
MSTQLAEKTCTACQGDEAPLKGEALDALRAQLGADWRVINEHHLEKTYPFDDFRQALDFTNRVGALAEEQGHHPDVYLSYGEVRLQIWTHKIKGLTESDFIFAAKADEVG